VRPRLTLSVVWTRGDLGGVAAGVKACDASAEVNAKSCNDVYRGKLVPGTRCTSDIECAPPSGLDAQCANGVCVVVDPPMPLAKEGEACGATAGGSISCELGLACDPDTHACAAVDTIVGLPELRRLR
jgi:hypothetical protein